MIALLDVFIHICMTVKMAWLDKANEDETKEAF